MRPIRLLALALVACTTTKTAEQHAEVGLETRKVERVETHTEEGEWSVKTWEFAPGEMRAGGRGAPETAYPPSAAVRPQDLPDSNRATVKATASIPRPAEGGHPSFLAWPTDGDAPLIRYSEEVHSPTKTTSLSDAEQQTTLKAASEAHSSLTRSWWPPAWLLACLALGAAVALWALRRKIGALKGLL